MSRRFSFKSGDKPSLRPQFLAKFRDLLLKLDPSLFLRHRPDRRSQLIVWVIVS